MFVLDPADESFMEVIGSNTSMVASFSSTTNNAYVRIYANDPSSNIGYVLGSSNVATDTPLFVIGELANDACNVDPRFAIRGGNIGIGTLLPKSSLHVTSTLRLDSLVSSRILVSDDQNQIASSSVSSSQLTYLSDVTSGIQSQLNAKQNTITGAASSITTANLSASKILLSDANGKVIAGDATSNEAAFLVGVSSPIQTQLDSKEATITGAASTITSLNLATSRVLISNSSGKVAVGDASSNELSFLKGTTAPIQSQLDSKLPLTGGIISGNLTVTDTFTTSNLVILSSTNVIDASTYYTSNIKVTNINGIGPALQVTQKTISGKGNVAEFYDYDISSTTPVFIVGDNGKIGIGTSTPQYALDVQGSIASSSLSPDRVVISNSSNVLVSSSVTTSELAYLSGTTSSVQTQLNAKQATITGAATTITSSDLATNKIIISDGSGKIRVGDATSNEVSYLVGVSSPIQTQLNAKLPLSGGTIGGNLSILGTLSASNLNVVGDTTIVNAYSSYTSNIVVENLNGVGPALTVKQKTVVGSGNIAEFYDTDISNTTPVFLIADNGSIGIGTSSPLQKLHVQGSILSDALTANTVLIANNSKTISSSSVSTTELGYLSGTTSSIQTQLNGKQSTITGAATSITSSNLATNRVVISNGDGKIATGDATSNEISYLVGVTSPLQTQINGKEATITGAASSITSANLASLRVLVSDASGKVATSSISSNVIEYLSGVTSSVQGQINSKQDTIVGAASTVTLSNLAASKAIVSDASGKISTSSVTATEIGYLSGVTSGLQAQINSKLNTSGGTVTSTLYTSNISITSSGSIAGLVITHDNGPAAIFYNSNVSTTVPSFVVSNTGNVGLGTDTPNYKLHVEGNIYANQIAFASDATLKTNVHTISNALSLVESLRGVSYQRIDTGDKQIGVIAQEVRDVIPEVVGESPQGLSVAYGNMVAVLIEAVKELSNEVKQLRYELSLKS